MIWYVSRFVIAMTLATEPSPGAQALPDGPHDLEFFLDPMCPFAWQTSVWIRRVAELRELRVGWRFVSLHVIHENDAEPSPNYVGLLRRGLELHRVLAAVRAEHGNDEVGRLYESWGRRLWYGEAGASVGEIAASIDVSELLSEANLPTSLADAVSDDSFDDLLRAETTLAFARAGDDLGTPIITYGPPDGPSFFGPVISSIPSDEDAVAIYDSLRTLAAFPDFAEIKRTKRPDLDLPVLRPAP